MRSAGTLSYFDLCRIAAPKLPVGFSICKRYLVSFVTLKRRSIGSESSLAFIAAVEALIVTSGLPLAVAGCLSIGTTAAQRIAPRFPEFALN
jgi:hypothetical protein